jgi:putative ABC transport system substrate-binding protein
MRFGSRDRLTLFCVVALAVCLASRATAEATERECVVAIVKSWDLPEYNTAIGGFLDTMSQQRVKCKTATYNLQGQTEGGEQVVGKIRASKPDLILTVGSRATEVMSKNFRSTPIVFSMVLYPVASAFVANIDKPGENVTGAAMDVPIERQLRVLLRIMPKLKRVGVLYSPDETLPVIEEARRVARSMNMQMIAEPVDAEGDVPDALGRLDKQKIEALWSVADGKVFTRPSTRYVIEYVLHRGIPFMGPHNGFVKAGALVALTADYRDNGRQAGEIAVQILNGAKPESIAVGTPRKVEMALNLQVAGSIGLKIPQSIIDDATQVFE